MIAVFAKAERETEPLTGEIRTFANPMRIGNVKLVYLSMAPKEVKCNYVRLDQLQGFFTPEFYTSELSEKYMTVYVVEFGNGAEPMILPTDKFTLNAITNEEELING